MQINTEVFYKLVLSFWVSVTRYAQSTPNKFAFLYNISKKAWGWSSFSACRWTENMIVSLWVFTGRHAQSIQNNSFTISLQQYVKENVKNEVNFLPADKHQSSLQVDFNTLVSTFSTRWYYHYRWEWSSILKVYTQNNKLSISLQYLKNKVGSGVHFLHVDKHQNFYKLTLSYLMEVATHA